MAQSGQLVKGKGGKFVKGNPGGPGRPKGSKNVITVQKLMLEEAFRGDQENAMGRVLELVVEQALTGDKAAQKLVWDACVSKQAMTEDKAAGKKQEINVKTMHVTQVTEIEGEFIDETESKPKESLQ